MISMTGFGRGEASSEGIRYRAEITSVNRKQADIVVHLPRGLVELEREVRRAVSQSVTRGRVNVHLSWEAEEGATVVRALAMDEGLAESYIAAFRRAADILGAPADPAPGEVLRAPGILEVSEPELSPDVAWQGFSEALATALEKLVSMRKAEGVAMAADLVGRLKALRGEVSTISELAPAVAASHRSHLLARLAEADLEVALDDERILKEIAVFAEKCDISEELARIDSHFAQFESYLESDAPVGRELDFLAQELFREFNTIGSKANNADIAQRVVAGKAELEKVREQVQNIE